MLKSDYSIFHPTITQVEIIYFLCDELSKRINLEPFVLRQIFIKGIIIHQQEAKIFHMDIEHNLPQIRLKRSMVIIDKILEEFSNLLVDDGDDVQNKLKAELDRTLREYMNSYATRKAGEFTL